MAISVAVINKIDIGDRQQIIADVTFDASYPTGGEAVLASDFGFRLGLLEDVKGSNAGRIVSFDPAAATLLVHEDQAAASAAALDEVPNATDLSGLTVRCTATGK